MDAPGLDDIALCHLMLKYLEQSLPQTLSSTPKRYAIYLPTRAPTSPDEASFSSGLYIQDWPASASTASQYSRNSASPLVNDDFKHECLLHDDETPATSEADLAQSVSSETCLEPNYGLAERGIKYKYRQSSHDALRKAREEAIHTMETHEIQGEKNIPCLRPGCQDRLMDLSALTCHLHIHNMTDAYDPRPRTDSMHGTGCYFGVPTCHTSHSILPMNRIRRIISRMMCRR